jgi:AraC-like DNA-binding protein
MGSNLSYLCGLATMVFITTGLVVAAVRWFHMCRPYDRDPGYYYPGRPFVTGIFLSFILLLPYALNPESEDAWHLTQMFFLPYSLYHFAVMLCAYFGSVMQWRRWRWPILIIGSPVIISIIVAEILALIPGDHIGLISRVNLLVLGAIMTGVCITALWVVLTWAHRFDEDDFSNPADYPVPYARRWSVLIVLNMGLCWAGVLANNRALMAVIMLIFAGASVFMLITALHPHRNKPVEEELEAKDRTTAPPAPAGEVYHRPLTKKKQADILKAIQAVVEGEEAFRDPHLTLQEVAVRSGYNRTYISGLIKTQYGGFFNYVNRLRLEYVDAWMEAHPAGTLQEAIEDSGFGSRQSYYSVKSRLEGKE